MSKNIELDKFYTPKELLHVLQNSDEEQCTIPVVTKRNWFEKLPLHWRFLLYYIGGQITGMLILYVW